MMKKRLLALVLTLCMTLSLLPPAAAVKVSLWTTHKSYVPFQASVSPVQQFAYKNQGLAFAYLEGGKLQVVTPNKSFSVPALHPLLGDVISDDDGNFYVVWGRENKTDDTSVETVFISKYSPGGTLVKTTGFAGEGQGNATWRTKIPFDAGKCEGAIADGKLMVNYARKMYNGHQSNNVVSVNIADMSPFLLSSMPYASHSLGQSVIWSERANNFVYADAGDSFDRGFIISSQGRRQQKIFTFYLPETASVLNIHAQLGGLAETSKGVVLVGSSAKSISKEAKTEKQNLFIQIFDPNALPKFGEGDIKNAPPELFVGGTTRSGATSYCITATQNTSATPATDYGVHWLTDYTDTNAIAPQVVVADDKIVILWSTEWTHKQMKEKCQSYFMVLSAGGDVIKPATLIGDVPLNSYENPIYYNGEVHWAAVKDKVLQTYSLDLNQEAAPPPVLIYPVTYYGNGGKVSIENADIITAGIEDGAPLTATATRDGYTFNGWFTAVRGGTQVTHGKAEEMRVFAQWTADPNATPKPTPTPTPKPTPPPSGDVMQFDKNTDLKLGATTIGIKPRFSDGKAREYTLTSSNPAVARVDGLKVTGVSLGKATITASSPGLRDAICTVEVYDASIPGSTPKPSATPSATPTPSVTPTPTQTPKPAETQKPNVPATATAAPSSTKLTVNGKAAAVDAYLINENNYIKLRDLAALVNGTDKNFEVTWDGERNAINLKSASGYTPVGGEMVPGTAGNREANLTTSAIYVDGVQKPLTAYLIGQNNYFKLRDVMQTFDVYVGWDQRSGTASLDTSKGYEVPAPAATPTQTPAAQTVAVADGVYQLVAANNSKNCIGIGSSSTESGAAAVTWTNMNIDDQKFTITKRGDRYSIIAVHSGLALTVNGADEKNTAIVQKEYTGSKAQLFDVIDAGNGNVHLVTDAGLRFAIVGGSTEKGAKIVLWSASKSTGQQFKLTPVE